MTDPSGSSRPGSGPKAPPKPFTVEEGHRKVRSFVLRRAAMKSDCETLQRVATRQPNSFAGCGLHRTLARDSLDDD